MTEHTIPCPHCGGAVDVQAALYQQISLELSQEQEAEFAEIRKNLHEKERQLKADKASVDDEIEQRLRKALASQRAIISKELETEQRDAIALMQHQLDEKSEQVKLLHKKEAEVESLKREKTELRSELEVENQKKLTEMLAEERIKIKKEANEATALRVKEQEIVINQLKSSLADAQSKAEQGSMQLQGEAQELVIEDWLAENYPLDIIIEIKKGARGGDCIQQVYSQTGVLCGEIYYESKRTRTFQPAWIDKFKTDVRTRGAHVGVLITQSMPNGVERMSQINGVWVCGFDEFKNVSMVLRASILKHHSVVRAEENRGEKVHMLYDYLTGNEFRLSIEAIMDGFNQMQDDLNREKTITFTNWKKREKAICKVLECTAGMYGSIQGIAGSDVPAIELLEAVND